MNPLKEKYLEMKRTEAEYWKCFDLCDEHPDDATLEAEEARLYEIYWNASEEFCREMERFTGGRVDAKTARDMSVLKADELADLMARWAA